ncbi:MAG: G8 domain-containing protein [Vicinamibacterales bacterium]
MKSTALRALSVALMTLSGWLLAPGSAQAAICDQFNCQTMHDTIPNFAGSPTIRSMKSGNWSSPTTWNLGRVPNATDIVDIIGGTVVTVDTTAAVAGTIGIESAGKLMFRTDISTRLTVGTLLVLPQGTLEVGTPAAPVASTVTAEIVIADVPLDLTNDGIGVFDPRQFGTGLIAVDAKVSLSGAVKTPYIRLAGEPKAGDLTLTLSAPVSGWRPGDVVFLPDSRHIPYSVRDSYVDQSETLTVASVASNGLSVTLTSAVQFAHPGARDGNGVLEFLPHVANLSRSVVVRSQNPLGTRGHILFTERCDIDVRYFAYQNLGRTTIYALDVTTFDSAGAVTHIGTNQIGRYPLHFHHMLGPVATPANGYQFTIMGVAQSDDAVTNDHKWAITIHGSHYGLIDKNVISNAGGWGIGTEDGSESYNVFSANFVGKVRGNGDNQSSEAGNGIWMRGPNNYLRDNVVANTHGVSPNTAFGYSFQFRYLGGICVPNFKGADMSQCTTTNGNAMPLREFARNEAYGAMDSGLTFWWLGTQDTTPIATGVSTITDFRTWHFSMNGFYFYPTSKLLFDGFVVRGNKAILANGGEVPAGANFSDYMTHDFVMQRADIQNVRVGIWAPYFMKGTATFQDSYLRNAINVRVSTIGAAGSSPYGPSMPPKNTILKNLQFATPSGNIGGAAPLDIQMDYNLWSGSSNLVKHDGVYVYSFNKVAGDDFQVFYNEQVPTFVVPQSSGNLAGSPVAGLTNAQNMATYGLAIAGGVAPSNTVSRNGIYGLVLPGTPAALSAIPTITAQPAGANVMLGSTATFSVTATGGAPLRYQWQKNFVAINGAIGPTYTTPPTVSSDNGASYRVLVDNASGQAISAGATLVVGGGATAPTVTAGPIAVTVPAGATATFTVAATGTGPLTYQWLKNNVAIPGATSASYTTPPTVSTDSGSQFRALVGNAAGQTGSGEAALWVTAASTGTPTITTQPVSVAVNAGATATFGVVASGSGLTYQWQKNLVNIAGATGATYTTPATTTADSGSAYRVLVSNTSGQVASASATLTVNAVVTATKPAITTQPASVTVTAGATATFAVVASGTGPLTYQWQKNAVNIAGATGASYTTPATTTADSGSTFQVVVTNSAGQAASTAATLTVNAAATKPSITTQPANVTVTAGAVATFSVVATGTGPLTYQWQKNAVNIAGATGASYTTPVTTTADSGSTYKVSVTNSAGQATSTAATLTVNAAVTLPSIATQPASVTVTAGATATFSVVATGSGTLTYQWQKNAVNIAGATGTSYTTPVTTTADSGSTYRVVVTNAAGPVTSAAATLTVNAAGTLPTITTQPASVTVKTGSTALFSVVATGTGPLTYQWQKNAVNIAGATGASYTTPATVAADNGATFRVIVTNAAGPVTSAAATLTLATAPAFTAQPASQSVKAGTAATFSVTVSGTGPFTYQWQKNLVNIAGATGASYTTPATVAADNGSTYRVTVTNAAGSATSATATLTVTTPPSITTQPASATVKTGATATFSVVAAGTGPLTYQWQKNAVNIAGATGTSYSTPATVAGDSGSTYRVVVTNAAGQVTSAAATLTVATPPTFTAQPASVSVKAGTTATFSATVSGTGPFTYQWQKNLVNIAGATGATYTTPAAVAGDNGSTYRVTVTNAVASATSATATLTVTVPPTITTQPASATVTLGAKATFSVVASGTGTLTYQWQKNGVNITGATTASYTTPVTVSADSGSTYRVVVTNASGSVTSASATLTIGAAAAAPSSSTTTNKAPVVSAGLDQAVTLAAGTTLLGKVTDDGLPSGSAVAVRWDKMSGPGTVMLGNGLAALTSAKFSVAGTYVMRLIATDSALTAFDEVVITVTP